ncbi:hypothetical protein H1C71_021603, partial [Ictidomys tridecemlineatus]
PSGARKPIHSGAQPVQLSLTKGPPTETAPEGSHVAEANLGEPRWPGATHPETQCSYRNHTWSWRPTRTTENADSLRTPPAFLKLSPLKKKLKGVAKGEMAQTT